MKTILFLITLGSVTWSQVIFKHVKGDVIKYVEVNKPQEVKKGDVLEEDETVVLEDNAQVVIKLDNHSVQRVEGPAEFNFESFAYQFEDSEEIEKPASLLMETGTFFIKVLKKSDNESMLIKTRETTFGIRGTEFLVDVPESRDIILSVNEGAVEVKNQKQADILSKGSSLFIEKDKVFKKMRDSEIRNSIDWKFSALSEKKQKFRERRKAERENIRKNLVKWNRDELKWSKFKEKRKERLEKWKNKTADLRSSKKLRQRETRKKLRKERRQKNQEKMKKLKDANSEKWKKKRNKLRESKIEELKKKRLKNPNSFMDDDIRKMRRQRARQKMMEKRRRLNNPINSDGTGNTGGPVEN